MVQSESGVQLCHCNPYASSLVNNYSSMVRGSSRDRLCNAIELMHLELEHIRCWRRGSQHSGKVQNTLPQYEF